jgi:hypothetical protein
MKLVEVIRTSNTSDATNAALMDVKIPRGGSNVFSFYIGPEFNLIIPLQVHRQPAVRMNPRRALTASH